MATTVAALRGKLGSTEYYLVSMKAKELVDKAIIPSELDDWDDIELEERYQRDINYTRVKNHIAPYLASDPDRFFGSIILAAKDLDPNPFEPIGKMTKELPNLYQTTAKTMGFLTLSGGEQLIPLDGQHRLKAIRFAIEGKDHQSKDIRGISPCLELANEDVSVILVRYESSSSRKIFTKVNRYAKSTTTGQNLVTDDDDIFAVTARMVANEIIGAHLVKYKSNTLSNSDGYFTTLATIAQCNEVLLKEKYGKIDNTKLPDMEKQQLYEGNVRDAWEFLSKNIPCFSDMLADKTKDGDKKRQEIRRDYMLGKPVPQVCLFRAYVQLTESNSFSPEKAVDCLNRIDWSREAEVWDRLLLKANKSIEVKNKNIATDIIFYMAGGNHDQEGEKELLKNYQKIFPEEDRNGLTLPPRVC